MKKKKLQSSQLAAYGDVVMRFMRKRRPLLNGTLLEYLFVTLLFTAITIVLTNFVAFHITTQLFAAAGDATAGFLWLNAVDPSLNPLLPVSDMVNYPYGQQLGSASFITYYVLWLPLRFWSVLFGPVAGLNIVTFSGFISAALSMYWLVKRLTNSWHIALFAGYAAAFTPYAMIKSSAHLAYIFSFVFVLILAAFMAVWSRPTVKRAILFGATIAFAFYTDGYFLLLGTVMVGGLCVAGIVQGLLVRFKPQDYWKRIKFLALSAASLVVFILPILYVQLTQSTQIAQSLGNVRSNIANEIIAYRSNIVDFMAPAADNPFLINDEAHKAVSAYKGLRSNPSESMTYMGYVVIFLMATGAILLSILVFMKKHSSLKSLDESKRRQLVLLGAVALVTTPLFLAFMFSPEVTVLGHAIPLPGKFFIDHNLALWRVMTRFFIPLHVVAVAFAAVSLWMLLKSFKLVDTAKRANKYLGVSIVLVLGLITAVEYATSIYRPSFDFTKVQSGYLWLKDQDDIKAIAELPIVDVLDDRTTGYITNQIVHGKKITNLKESDALRLTGTLGSVSNSETIDWAYRRGVQAVVVHDGPCKEVNWGELVFKDESNSKYPMCIYRIKKPVSQDKLFIRYDKGFNPSPNQVDQSSIALNSGKASMALTDNSFKENGHGKATIEMTLAGPKGSRWTIKQGSTVISEGAIEEKEQAIKAVVDASRSVELSVKHPDNQPVLLGQFSISRAKATSL